MNTGTKYLIIILSILAIVSIGLYVKYELPRMGNIESTFSNLSISARHNGNYIETNLVIQNGETRELNTRKGYELLRVKNGIYKIYNNKSGDFYRSVAEYNITKDTRIDFELSKPSEVKVKSTDNGSVIKIEISSDNYQNAKVCLKYSFSYIFVSSNLTKIDLLDGYEDWDKCYSLKSIKNKEVVNVSYEVFRMPEENDFIEIAVIDTDYVDGEYKNRLNGIDLGGEDVIVKVK